MLSGKYLSKMERRVQTYEKLNDIISKWGKRPEIRQALREEIKDFIKFKYAIEIDKRKSKLSLNNLNEKKIKKIEAQKAEETKQMDDAISLLIRFKNSILTLIKERAEAAEELKNLKIPKSFSQLAGPLSYIISGAVVAGLSSYELINYLKFLYKYGYDDLNYLFTEPLALLTGAVIGGFLAGGTYLVYKGIKKIKKLNFHLENELQKFKKEIGQ
ncbi:MAG: hypothetical protein N3D10_03635 [Candidatus Micrarchaeota archaeon]|nr:hypothetical protein [Candidatus Micrarchaeota archaeon]